jgi:hypothetical protein
MQEGCIVEQGNHQALQDKGGSYANLWRIQQQQQQKQQEPAADAQVAD